MPLDFPSSPANGAVYEQYVYDSALPGWRSKGGAVAATYTSDTAPSGAVKGDMWYRTSDGTTFVYVVDANTSQWVEIRSEISTAKVGLVPIIPTSVTVGSGSASVDGSGIVTFTGATNVSLNGIFTATYSNYRIMLDVSSRSQSSFTHFRLRSAGTDTAGTNYDRTITAYTNVNTPQANASTSGDTWSYAITNNARGNFVLDVMSPYPAVPTTSTASWTELTSGTAVYSCLAHGFHRASTSFDGITAHMAAGTGTGSVRIYGWN